MVSIILGQLQRSNRREGLSAVDDSSSGSGDVAERGDSPWRFGLGGGLRVFGAPGVLDSSFQSPRGRQTLFEGHVQLSATASLRPR